MEAVHTYMDVYPGEDELPDVKSGADLMEEMADTTTDFRMGLSALLSIPFSPEI